MGLVNFGIPEKETLFLKEALNLNVFVEGGTYLGGTAKSMSPIFSKVYTIEKSAVMHDKAEQVLKGYSNVSLLKGDTREHLKEILEQNENILFWLDAHWSGGDTYGVKDECPLLDELEIIFSYERNAVILIDDARCFLAPPPHPHNYKAWPSLTDIVRVIPINWELLVFEDVIYLVGDKEYDDFRAFLQVLITNKAKKSGKSLLSELWRKVRSTCAK